MKYVSMLLLTVVCCIGFIGCAVSTTTVKKGFTGDFPVVYVEIPFATSNISNKKVNRFESLGGDIYAPQFHVPAVFGIGAEYKIHFKNGGILCPGARMSYFFKTSENEVKWDNSIGCMYHAALDNIAIIEPYIAREIDLPSKIGSKFLKIDVGVPVIYSAWRKYYDLQAGIDSKEWNRHYLEYRNFWNLGLSGGVSLNLDCIGIGYRLTCSSVDISGERVTSFINRLFFNYDLRETRTWR